MSKEIVNRIQNEIENARGTYIWDDYVNSLRLISQVVFTRSSGFILELIQNAEDSGLGLEGSGSFEICINQQRVKITHNGKPFDENDVKAISGIRSSKKPERGFLGYLGIGFKSVLKITDCPEIYSNGFQFKFDRTYWDDPSSTPWHVIPIWIDKPSELIDPSKTTFIIPFREATDAELITEEIKKIRLELYLFLRWLKKIEIVNEISDEPKWTLENLGENQDGITILKSNGEERRFKFFRRNVEVPDWVKEDRLTQEYRANVTQREIAIGFALDKDGNLAPDEAGAMYGGVYSFLPLSEAKSGAKFPIQADFLVQPGRDALNYEAKWNHWILEEVKNLSLKAINFFKTHDTCKYQYLQAFEFTDLKLSESHKLFYPGLIEPIKKHLSETECVLTIDDQWAKFNEVIRLTEEEKAFNALLDLELFTKEEIASAFGQREDLKLAHPDVKEQKKQPLAKADRRNLIENSEFLQTKTREPNVGKWFAKLYMWLDEYPQYEPYRPYRARHDSLRIKGYYNVEFILAADNSLKKGGDVYIPDLSSNNPAVTELASKSSKPIIHPDIFSNAEKPKRLRSFLTGLVGVQILNAKTICKEMILPKIFFKSEQPPQDELLDLTKLCKEILEADLGNGVEIWIRTKSGNVKSAKEVLLSSEFKPDKDWEKYQEYVDGLNFVDNAYLPDNPTENDLKSWREFFYVAGVKEKPDKGVEQFAIKFVIEKLKEEYRNIQDVTQRNYGFDIQAETFDGILIQVEVKGLSSDQDIELTSNETNAADKYRDSFYLYVVTSIPNSPALYVVQNPVSKGKKDKLIIPINVWKKREKI